MSAITTTTSTTRDLTGVAGQIEFETDTSNVVVNDGVNWRHFRRLGDIQDLANESDILATNTNPPNGYATLVYGADTNSFYVNHDGLWYSFNNDTSEPFADLQSITTTNTESQILSSDPVDYTIEQASDTYNLFVRHNDMWFKYEYIMPNSYSLSFDGFEDHGVSSYVAPSSLTAISYSFWMKSSNTTSSITLGPSDASTINNAKSFRVLSPSNTKAYYVIVNDGTGFYLNNSVGGQDATISGSTNIRDGLWHHLVFTVSGTSVKIYIDGGDAAINASNSSNSEGHALSVTSTKSYAGGENSYFLGKNGQYDSYYYDGLMDEVAVFEYELTASQVRSIYNSGTPKNLASYSPNVWWRMGDNDSTTGTTITDQRSGGNNLTLINGPTFSSDVPNQ